jgi:predicted nucleic acid-binding protein
LLYLLDTNVISDVRRLERTHAGVRRFFGSVSSSDCAISVITLGELKIGIERVRLKDQTRAGAMLAWLDRTLAIVSGRVLPIDQDIMDVWSRMAAPRSLPQFDSLIAATALRHGLTVVTRNVKDFAIPSLFVSNPFAET